ncbi:MAG: phosphoglycerate kinase / triosephosphate isomerase [Parcubacteria group bacterium Licking1014_1]|nr:MAG: phosphoglycerate kinase / triosephosphate isomerase [Parcubacteria group bacterium Licking1014_1]
MNNLIAANWKMNPVSLKEAEELFEKIKNGVKETRAEVVICPPFVFLPLLIGASSSVKTTERFVFGSQNVFYEEKGAFTGEISPAMLKDLGIKYVIIGHSERRKFFGETNEQVNKKIKKALLAGLKIIFCVGETAEERDAGKKSDVLEKQLKDGLKGISKEEIKKITIAYEPVWAIGTGNNCSIDETMRSVLYIRKVVAALYDRQSAKNARILYGGSVKSDNSGFYIKDSGINGLLVGGASLNAEEFLKILKSAG